LAVNNSWSNYPGKAVNATPYKNRAKERVLFGTNVQLDVVFN